MQARRITKIAAIAAVALIAGGVFLSFSPKRNIQWLQVRMESAVGKDPAEDCSSDEECMLVGPACGCKDQPIAVKHRPLWAFKHGPMIAAGSCKTGYLSRCPALKPICVRQRCETAPGTPP